jgi:hypothetical protein
MAGFEELAATALVESLGAGAPAGFALVAAGGERVVQSPALARRGPDQLGRRIGARPVPPHESLPSTPDDA